MKAHWRVAQTLDAALCIVLRAGYLHSSRWVGAKEPQKRMARLTDLGTDGTLRCGVKRRFDAHAMQGSGDVRRRIGGQGWPAS